MLAGISVYLAMVSLHLLQVSKTGKKLPIQTEIYCAAHSRSEHHKNAMQAWKEHQIAETNHGSLMGQLNKEYNKTVEENRGYIKTLAEVVLHCATENIALRGHCESVAIRRKGNFLGMLNIIANHDEKI